ncbi:MAG TPA: ABC transporter permease [Candidatus Limnocylindrales bacterium]|nr:ABC transporter permease [Candidatus Limnocylindrales bacterium]
MTVTAAPPPGRLSPRDILRLGAYGLRARPLRVVLSALGIAIGIAAMVAVVGTSTSSRAQLNRLLDSLGTNLLTVAPGLTLFGEEATLPDQSVAMIGRIRPVESVTAIGLLADAKVYRTDRIPAPQSGGIGTYAVRTGLLGTVRASVRSGIWLNSAIARYPAVVLGAATADRLGIGALHRDTQIWLGGRWFTVIGILNPVPLAPELDLGALIGWPAAQRYLGFDGDITTIYTRTNPDAVEAARDLLARTANPAQPNEVDVSRPSDALAAKAAADKTLTALLLGLGAVALLVGGIGVANTMVISVLERRSEIGLRRSLGATREHIRSQFLTESLLLSLLGGGAGIVLGSAVTAVYATIQGWPTDVPTWAVAGGLAAALSIGGVAGLYPAIRAARVAPTEALAAT